MNSTGYKILGFVVWKGVRWYVARRLPSRRVLAAGFVVVAVVGIAAAGARRHDES